MIERERYMTTSLPSEIWINVQNMIVNVKKIQRKDIVDLKVSNCDKYIIGIESCCYRHAILMGKFLHVIKK